MAKGKTDLTISRELLDRYDARLKEQEAKASRYVDDAIASYINANPNASTAQVRQFSYDIMQAALPNFTDLAETLSCEFMQELADRHGWDIEAPRLWDTTDYDLVNEKLHYLAGYLNDGDVDRFKKSVHDVTEFYVRRSAQEAMIKNCERSEIRYARIPSGSETCPFCIMLASRGFVYWSEKKAGKNNHFHPHCDCLIIPGYEGMEVEGYDTDALYDQYVEDLKSGKLSLNDVERYSSSSHVIHWSSAKFDSYGDFVRFVREAKDIEDLQVRCAFVDQEWKKTGLSDRYRNMLVGQVQQKRWQLQGLYDAEHVTYLKPRSELTDSERKGIDGLAKLGKKIIANEEDSSASANIDLTVDGNLAELKNVTSISSSVGNQVSRTRKKWWKSGEQGTQRTVFTMCGSESSVDDIVSALRARIRDNEEFYLLDKEGNLHKI